MLEGSGIFSGVSRSQGGSVDSGRVHEVLLDGMYRVDFGGVQTVARSQAGPLSAGQQVVLASTPAGLTVVSAGSVTSVNHVEVVIDG